MTQRVKIWWCIFVSLFVTFCVTFCVTVPVIFLRDNESTYFRWGPNTNLIVISVRIDTWIKYWVLVLFMGLIKSSETIIGEIASPILGFNVYNPDKKKITEFTKNELNFLANVHWMITGVRGVIMMMISISQIDLALIGLLCSEVTSIFVVRHLLNEKEFVFGDTITELECFVEDTKKLLGDENC